MVVHVPGRLGVHPEDDGHHPLLARGERLGGEAKQACFSMYLPAFEGAAFITACAVTGRSSVFTTR